MPDISLETGLVAGGLLVALGVWGSIFAVSGWARESFGALDAGHMLAYGNNIMDGQTIFCFVEVS